MNAASVSVQATRREERDRFVNRELRKAGWRVVRVWEHDIVSSAETKFAKRLRRIEATWLSRADAAK